MEPLIQLLHGFGLGKMLKGRQLSADRGPRKSVESPVIKEGPANYRLLETGNF